MGETGKSLVLGGECFVDDDQVTLLVFCRGCFVIIGGGGGGDVRGLMGPLRVESIRWVGVG